MATATPQPKLTDCSATSHEVNPQSTKHGNSVMSAVWLVDIQSRTLTTCKYVHADARNGYQTTNKYIVFLISERDNVDIITVRPSNGCLTVGSGCMGLGVILSPEVLINASLGAESS
jgi:hypothetical protein